MIALIVIISCVVFYLGYRFYGAKFARELQVDNANITPAESINDGVDFVPAKPMLLLGQHFSAISAAGPIVGPVLACMWFGWLPAILWILLGSIFIGGIHDFGSLLVSVRHKAASIAEIVHEYMSPTSHILFLLFIWVSLLYVIIAFTDVTANTFKIVSSGEAYGPGVAASSILYLFAALVMGVLLYRFKAKLSITTAIFIPIVLLIIWIGPRMPEPVLTALGSMTVKQWDIILLAYCFIASIIPMWLLLQPRGYLGGWLLYLVIIVGLMGALFGGYALQYPAVNLKSFHSVVNNQMLFPALFITIACGAISGFHSIVASGTTSRQLAKEKDAVPVGYGSMILEGVVAVIALATVMMLPVGSEILKSDPNIIYADGIAKYFGLIGVGFSIAFPFALLAFSTFVYDTLDVCTRLARYIFQEFTGWKSKTGGYVAALASLVLPFIFLMTTKEKGYLVAWPLFGTSNQLLASLTLLTLSVWLYKTGKNYLYTFIPMIFLLTMTFWSLINLIAPFFKAIPTLSAGETVKPDIIIAGVFGSVFFVLAFILIFDAIKTMRTTSKTL
jgi:carbon starvation protein